MKIRKKFKVESAHIVRNCTSRRCSHSIHGHSGVVEIILTADNLDYAQMVCDFGLLEHIKSFVDSMDHTYLMCNKESAEFKDFIKASCDRYIELPFNPTAEMLALYIHHEVQRIIDNTKFANGEGRITVESVIYHETETGYAQTELRDFKYFDNKWCDVNSDDHIVYSNGIQREWTTELRDFIRTHKYIMCNKVINQINL